MKILVSACLLGEACKYNGGHNYSERVAAYVQGHDVLALCPEVAGGLPVPRTPAEIVDGRVQTRDGQSVDNAFRLGAQRVVEEALRQNVELAILQSRSPSCGVNEIYDGTFSGCRIRGSGVCARMLMERGIRVLDAEDIP